MAQKNYKDMTAEEKAQAYQEMMEKREGKRETSKAKRAATKQLIANHEPEFKKLLAAAEKEQSGK